VLVPVRSCEREGERDLELLIEHFLNLTIMRTGVRRVRRARSAIACAFRMVFVQRKKKVTGRGVASIRWASSANPKGGSSA